MSSKVSFWLLLRLAILLAAFLAQSSEGATYRDFRNRHIDSRGVGSNNPNAYCNRLMQQRGMTRGRCKPTNTFILQSEGSIQNICRGGGRRVTPRRNLYNSNSSFNLITCRNRGRYPRCNYVARRQRRRIQVACVNRLPVHFQRVL